MGPRRGASIGDVVRIKAPWLAWPELNSAVGAISAAGYEARVVGGSVRDTLRALKNGVEPPADVDIDLATTAPPQEVIAAAEAAGLGTRPTGLSHGTVTILAGHRTFEITTLRSDINTDGRHADVAFTNDWAADARRRDFTINALYCDLDGRIFDLVGGLPDLENSVLKFIGDPRLRIREDFLRTLRLFRLSSTMPDMQRDPSAEAAATAEHAGLGQLSAERVQKEILKLLAAPGAYEAYEGMRRCGVLVKLLPFVPLNRRLARIIEIESRLGRDPSPLIRLTAACVARTGDAYRLADRLRFSRSQLRFVSSLAVNEGELRAAKSTADFKALLYRIPPEYRVPSSVYAHACSSAIPADSNWIERHAVAATWTPPTFPVSASDLIEAGLEPGPELGKTLRRLEDEWRNSDFRMTRDALLSLLTRPRQ